MASELLLGGGVHEDYFSRLTFIKRGAVFVCCLSPFSRLLQYLYTTEGLLLLITFPLLAAAAAVVVFFSLPVKRALPKLRRFLSAAPSRRDLSVYMFFSALSPVLTQADTLITKSFSPLMLIVSIT